MTLSLLLGTASCTGVPNQASGSGNTQGYIGAAFSSDSSSAVRSYALQQSKGHPSAHSSDFQWIKTTGPSGGWATSTCPSGWTLIAGGTGTTTGGGTEGIGSPNNPRTAWIAKATGTADEPVAWASCVDSSLSSYFKWVDASGTNSAQASCGSGYVLIMGYGNGTTSYGDWKNQIWHETGSGTVNAHAACVGVDVGGTYGLVASQVTAATSATAPCGGAPAGSVYYVLGGFDGFSTDPGPPNHVEHPDIVNLTWIVKGPNPTTTDVTAVAVCLPVVAS
jgi:hypothetical protein